MQEGINYVSIDLILFDGVTGDIVAQDRRFVETPRALKEWIGRPEELTKDRVDDLKPKIVEMCEKALTKSMDRMALTGSQSKQQMLDK